MFRNFVKIPSDLDILRLNLIICSAMFNFSTIVMPKFIANLLTETGLWLKSTSIAGIGLVTFGGNINAEDFLEITVTFLAFVHSSTLCNS